MGEIVDEFDEEEIQYSRIDERACIFMAKTPLVDVYRVMGMDGQGMESAKGESDTIGGFIVEQLGRLPKPETVILFEGISLTAEAVDNRRILRVKVVLPEATEEDNLDHSEDLSPRDSS